jgi:hypothetical protein
MQSERAGVHACGVNILKAVPGSHALRQSLWWRVHCIMQWWTTLAPEDASWHTGPVGTSVRGMRMFFCVKIVALVRAR